MRTSITAIIIALGVCLTASHAAELTPLPGTEPLTMDGDIAAQLVAGVDKFLLRKIDESATVRDKLWSQAGQTEKEQQAFYTEQRKQLAHMLGVRDERVKNTEPQWLESYSTSARLDRGTTRYSITPVRWSTVRDVFAEGMLILPTGDNLSGKQRLIAIPDADVTPEQWLGLTPGLPLEKQLARRLADNGYPILIPTLISRDYQKRNGRAKMTSREFVYRPTYELGRHPLGYEIEAVLAAIDSMTATGNRDKVSVLGIGEGGVVALYAAAIDTRIDHVLVGGVFGRKENVWQQPLDRNLFGVLSNFGDAEVSRLVAGELVVINDDYPELKLPSEGGAPAQLLRPTAKEWETEVRRAKIDGAKKPFRLFFTDKTTPEVTNPTLDLLRIAREPIKTGEAPAQLLRLRQLEDPRARQERLVKSLHRDTEWLLAESPYVRAEFMKNLDTSSPEKYAKSVEPYREKFKREVIGWFDDERLPPKPRSRKIIDKEKYTGYEVVLDVWPDVIAYGILLLPKDKDAAKPTKRPVVVCQHGLEGRPQDIIAGNHDAYHDFAAKLAERGFITFSPQNLYIGEDKFRTLQRKANPLGKTLFSVIIPQHQQIVAWLKTLPQVDGERIGFYGLSYGGKSAMRIPPLVPEYRLSICSADFNDWVWKNASTRSPYSYVWSKEYEIFEWDLGSTFNYAEMAALIAPRPFMVERGHFDGVAPDETVASEFAKVYHLYNARLKLGDRAQIEWFDGPHTINGQGTFRFLHKHLDWPEPKE